MIDTIYIEEAVREHPRTQNITARYPNARQIIIERHGDVFNASHQNFREQKKQPALILAQKQGKRVLPTPPGYHIGGSHNYYFSHMLNCVYDCRYCFLQGMYRSANYVVFVNTEDFFADISTIAEDAAQQSGVAWFFSGYDCDSLALDPITGFVDDCLDFLSTNPKVCLELRTKSTQIRPLLNRPALDNVVVAYSLSPEEIVSSVEHQTPTLQKRIDALGRLQSAGWKVGLRFDPLLYADNYKELYAQLIEQVCSQLDMAAVHSVSLGVFRLPKGFHKRIVQLYPRERLLASPSQLTDGMVSYPVEIEQAMMNFCKSRLSEYLRDDQYFPCS